MKLRCLAFCLLTLGFMLRGGSPACAATKTPVRELIVCGQEEVFVIDLDRIENGAPKKVWSWQAQDHPEIPEAIRQQLTLTSDCKPVMDGRRILIASSRGGVALVERPSGKMLFYATTPYAHSAEILPGNRVVVAEAEKANNLVLFDLSAPDKPLFKVELLSAHGVVWDKTRQVLWALSARDIVAYRLKDWQTQSPSLEQIAAYKLPDWGGHDLYPVPGTSKLSVSTLRGCWLFDCETHRIESHPSLPFTAGIKSIGIHPETGQLVYTFGDPPNWWTERVRFIHPTRMLRFPNQRYYKVRWGVPPAW